MGLRSAMDTEARRQGDGTNEHRVEALRALTWSLPHGRSIDMPKRQSTANALAYQSSTGPGHHVRARRRPWSPRRARAREPKGPKAFGPTGLHDRETISLKVYGPTGVQAYRLTGLWACGPAGVRAYRLIGSSSRGPPVPSDSIAWARGPAVSRSRGLEAHGPTGPIVIPRSCKCSCENLSTVQKCVWAHGPASHQSRGVS